MFCHLDPLCHPDRRERSIQTTKIFRFKQNFSLRIELTETDNRKHETHN